jgi:hypothetical protein
MTPLLLYSLAQNFVIGVLFFLWKVVILYGLKPK